jgi:calcineurin-like phosphoesterase family protein
MTRVFVIGDTHFGHAGMCSFRNLDGSKVRPWDNVEHMDEAMIAAWNRVVTKRDKVIHLGDFVMNRRYLSVADRLNGSKVLVMGNHDIFPGRDYLKHFHDVKGAVVRNGVIMTHLPIHPDSFGKRYTHNVHGHTHTSVVRRWYGAPDPRYKCVCVEQIDYQPVLLDSLFD